MTDNKKNIPNIEEVSYIEEKKNLTEQQEQEKGEQLQSGISQVQEKSYQGELKVQTSTDIPEQATPTRVKNYQSERKLFFNLDRNELGAYKGPDYDDQYWSLVPGTGKWGGYYKIRNIQGGEVIFSKNDRSYGEVGHYWGPDYDDQYWKIIPVDSHPSYFILKNFNDGSKLYANSDGRFAVTFVSEEYDDQYWEFVTQSCNVPCDDDKQFYPVGLLPWLADLKSWRSYNPADIDDVGMLIGIRDGNPAGNLLKANKSEYLNTDLDPSEGHYSWVYTTDCAIIYRWNSKQELDEGNYTRHSQLGSGKRVVCAGEFYLKTTKFPDKIWVDKIFIDLNNSSGHYKPDETCLKSVIDKFKCLGFSVNESEAVFVRN